MPRSLLDDATPNKRQSAQGLARKYRSIKGEYEQKFSRLNELANKADPTDAEETEAATLAGECRGLKGRLASVRGTIREFRTQLRERDTPANNLPHGSRGRQRPGDREAGDVTSRGGTRALGTTPAGEAIFGSDGASLGDSGAGTFGQQTWDAIQDPQYRRIYNSYLRSGLRGLKSPERRTLQEAQDDYGGIFVPAEWINQLIQRKAAPTRLAGMVRRLTTSRDKVQAPRMGYADPGNQYGTPMRVSWTDEIPLDENGFEVNDDFNFGVESIPIFTAMLSCGMSVNLAEDTAFNLEGWLFNELGITRDLLYEDMILNGSSAGQPTGLLISTGTNPNQIPTVNIGNPITPDGLLDLTGLIEEQYDENQVLVMRKTSTWRGLRKLKDASNRFLIGMGTANEGGLSATGRRTIDGYPVNFSAFMPAAGAAAKAIISGDFGGYWMPERLGLSIQVLKETKAKKNQREILVRLRFGGKPVQPWQFRVGVQS